MKKSRRKRIKKLVATGILICALVNSIGSGMMPSVEASGIETVQENEQFADTEQGTFELEEQEKQNEASVEQGDEEQKQDEIVEEKPQDDVIEEEKKPAGVTEKKPEDEITEEKNQGEAVKEEKKPADVSEEEKKPADVSKEENESSDGKGNDYCVTTIVNGVEVTLKATSDAFPSGADLKLKVEEITDERLEQAKEIINKELEAQHKCLSSYRLFDVTPILGNEAVQPLKPVQVSFKNLELKKEDGQIVSLAESSENTVMYHFMDQNTPEKMIMSAEADQIVTEWSHFSWMLAGELSDSGKPYNWNYEDEGGAYTLDYILNHYNVFISGDYLGSHVVGPMVVGGDARGRGFGGLSTKTESGEVERFPHTVPSYYEGYLHSPDNEGMPNITLDNSNLPVYLGKYNFEGVQGSLRRSQMENSQVPFFITNDDAYLGEGQYNYDQLYVNFKKVFPSEQSLQPRNIMPPSYVTDRRGSGHYDHDRDVSGRYEWLKGEKDGVVKVSNDGLLYGDENTPGTIKYYQNFEGYDLSGHKVSKVTVTEEMMQEVIDISNQLDIGPRTRGYSKYYDGNGNEVKELENKTVEEIEENPDLKDQYVFAVSTKKMNLNMDKQYTKVSLRVRPGNNITIEKMDMIQNMIYDYKTEYEIRNELTVIQTLEEKERLVLPSIYKSKKSDVFGENYQFGSIEDGGNFSVMYFAPNVEQVYAGFIDEDTIGGPQLTGHLVVPQADVWVAGGNYNGTIIARNVDARNTEGHMWRFQGKQSTQALDIHGKKYVDLQKPDGNEIFTFKATLEELGSNPAVIKTYTTENKLNGGFFFHIKEDDLKDNKSYRITVQEEELKPEHKGKYIKDPMIYVGEFTVTLSEHGTREPIKVNWIRYPEGKINPDKGISAFAAGDEILAFNNKEARSFKINKNWKDENGQPIINGEGCSDVKVDLYRSSKMQDGHTVTLKLYSGTSNGNSYTGMVFHTVDLGKVVDQSEVEIGIECIDKFNFGEEYATAGVHSLKINGKRIKSFDHFGQQVVHLPEYQSGAKIKTSITEDTLIEVFFTHQLGINYGTETGNQTPVPTSDMFDIDTSNVPFIQPVFDLSTDFYETRMIRASDNWELIWDGLPAYDDSGNPYYYKAVEHEGNYETEYDIQVVSFSDEDPIPEINITNTKKKFSNFNLCLNKVDASTLNPLKGAEFALYKKGVSEPLKFVKVKAGEYQYTEAVNNQKTEILATAGKKGHFMITGLPVGEYVLRETKAPNGYKKEQMELQFRINEDESFEITNPTDQKFAEITQSSDSEGQYNITYKNTAGVKLPGTGGNGLKQIFNGGLLLMIICFSILYYENKKLGREEKIKKGRKTL